MITLYTIDCPKCKRLEKTLEQRSIQYEVCRDRDEMEHKGFDFMPVLEVDGQIMNYSEAINWINERG
jgi:glutaredoxin